jgi:hypothetical protein
MLHARTAHAAPCDRADHEDRGGAVILLVLLALVAAYVVLRVLPFYLERQAAAPAAPVATPALLALPPGRGARPVRPFMAVPSYANFDSGLAAPARAEAEVAEKLGLDDIKRGVATALVHVTGKTGLGPAKGKSDVVQVKADADGRHYFVAADLPDRKRAAGTLAEIHRRAQYVLQAVDEQLDGNRRILAADGVDVTDNMKELLRRHYKKDVPLAEYHNPSDLTVGSNSDKGVMIETCLRSKYDPSQWTAINTLFRVNLHELAHSADFQYREDGEDSHGPDFARLHKYLMAVAENLGVYDCAEYKKSGGLLCGVRLDESYECGSLPQTPIIKKK